MSNIDPDPRLDPEDEVPPDDPRMQEPADESGMPGETIGGDHNEPGSQAPPASPDPEGSRD